MALCRSVAYGAHPSITLNYVIQLDNQRTVSETSRSGFDGASLMDNKYTSARRAALPAATELSLYCYKPQNIGEIYSF